MGITRSHLGDYEGSMNNVHKLTLNHELPQLTDLRILKVSRSGVQAEGSGPGPPSPCLWTKDINGRSGWVSGLAPRLPPYRPSHTESWEAGQPQPEAMSGSSGDTPPLHRRQTEGMPGAETRSQSGQHGPLMGWRQEVWRGGCTSRGGTPALGQRTCSNSGSAVKLPAVLGWALTPSDYWMTPISNLIYLLPWACMTTYSL